MKLLPPTTIKDAREFGKVAVLMGGWSAERDISLKTGKAVLTSLQKQDIDAYAIDPSDRFTSVIKEQQFDRAFIALHGRGGEDGTIQGALEFLEIPYTGSGVLGSAISMDKIRSKRLFEASGLATPPYLVAQDEVDLENIAERFGFPLAIKPAHEGSSIGLSKAEDTDQLREAYGVASTHDSQVMIEQWIDGPEYTAAILNEVVLPLVRIEAPNVFYDYEAKYFSNATRYQCPCGLSQEQEQKLAQQALLAFEATSARGWGRVDFLLDDQGGPQFLEVNTVPGMTGQSLVPMAARQLGCDFDELVWRILETSLVKQMDGVT